MSENNLKRDYPRIFLTDELGEVNWCQDRITAEDVEYVPASDLIASQAEVTRLRESLEKISKSIVEEIGTGPFGDHIAGRSFSRLLDNVTVAREALAPKDPS